MPLISMEPGRWYRQDDCLAGDVGGDAQISEAWEARFVRVLPDGQYAVVTRYFYVAGGPFRLERQTAYTVCTDPNAPGDTEVWSDHRFETVRKLVRVSAGVAHYVAQHAAREATEPTAGEWSRAGARPPLYAWPNPGTLGYQMVMELIRMDDFDDPWGVAGNFGHALAGVAWVMFRERFPAFQPGALTSRDQFTDQYPDGMLIDYVGSGQVMLEDLRQAYKVIMRYHAWVKLAGLDY